MRSGKSSESYRYLGAYRTHPIPNYMQRFSFLQPPSVEQYSTQNRFRAQLMHAVLITVLLASLLSLAVYYAWAQYRMMYVSAFAAMAYAGSLYFLRQGLLQPVFIGFFFTQQTIILTTFLIYGSGLGLDFALLTTLFVPVIFFDDFRIALSGLLVLFLLFVLIVAMDGRLALPSEVMPPIIASGRFEQLMKIGTFFILVVAVMYIVIQLRNIERSRSRILDSLSQKNKTLEEFNYIIAHDLRAPLRTIASFSQLLLKKQGKALSPEELAQQAQYLNYIVRGVRNMQEMFDDLLAYARVGGSNRTMELLDLSDVVAVARFNLGALLDQTACTLQVDAELPSVYGSRRELVQLFQNLIENAVKYRSDAQPCVTIASECERLEGCVVTVTDNGLGIDPAFLPDIFKPFLQHNRNASGHGIGLSICKKVMEEMGGTITVTSAMGQGTTFELFFPRMAVKG